MYELNQEDWNVFKKSGIMFKDHLILFFEDAQSGD